MISRTFDQQRFSPLAEINKGNVGDLRMAWSRGLSQGTQESTPLVHDGVMYVIAPGANVLALDAATGDVVWSYIREYPKDLAQKNRSPAQARSKNLAIYEDMIYLAAADGFLVALDARTGKVRWETKAHDYTDGTEHASGLLVAAVSTIPVATPRVARSSTTTSPFSPRTTRAIATSSNSPASRSSRATTTSPAWTGSCSRSITTVSSPPPAASVAMCCRDRKSTRLNSSH